MTPREGEKHNFRVATLADLGASAHYSVGTRILVDEDHTIYTSVGGTTDDIARRIGWEMRQVWTPDHVLANIRTRHTIFVDPVAAASLLLQRPNSVYADLRGRSFRVFFASARPLRDSGLLASRSTRYVDAIIEERQVENGYILRLFHLSPRSNHPRGDRLWP